MIGACSYSGWEKAEARLGSDPSAFWKRLRGLQILSGFLQSLVSCTRMLDCTKEKPLVLKTSLSTFLLTHHEGFDSWGSVVSHLIADTS